MPLNFFLPQVTRIPITGPDPYNTLVCVQAESLGGPQNLQKGKLSRWAVTVPTTFKLAGFDQRVPPVFDHSTTAYLSSLGPATDDNWVYAVDAVNGSGFDPVAGTYFVNINVAASPGSPADGTCVQLGEGFGYCFDFLVIQVTSFVVCFEPPLAAPAPAPVNSHRIRVAATLANAVVARRSLDLNTEIMRRMGLPATANPQSNPPAPAVPKKEGGCR